MIRRNEATQEVIFTADEQQEIVDALKEIFTSTHVGREYKQNCYLAERGEEDLEKIIRAAQLVSGSEYISITSMTRALDFLLSAGELKPKEFTPTPELVEPEEDTRPRDRNGKLLTPQQQTWSEYRLFAETASMAEVNRRKQADSGFASFVCKNLEREMGGGVGDAVTPAGTPASRVAPTAELVAFAKKFQVEPTQNLKPIGGYVTLAGEQLLYKTYLDLVNRATACGLL
jgi:hypothetical protein